MSNISHANDWLTLVYARKAQFPDLASNQAYNAVYLYLSDKFNAGTPIRSSYGMTTNSSALLDRVTDLKSEPLVAGSWQGVPWQAADITYVIDTCLIEELKRAAICVEFFDDFNADFYIRWFQLDDMSFEDIVESLGLQDIYQSADVTVDAVNIISGVATTALDMVPIPGAGIIAGLLQTTVSAGEAGLTTSSMTTPDQYSIGVAKLIDSIESTCKAATANLSLVAQQVMGDWGMMSYLANEVKKGSLQLNLADYNTLVEAANEAYTAQIVKTLLPLRYVVYKAYFAAFPYLPPPVPQQVTSVAYVNGWMRPAGTDLAPTLKDITFDSNTPMVAIPDTSMANFNTALYWLAAPEDPEDFLVSPADGALFKMLNQVPDPFLGQSAWATVPMCPFYANGIRVRIINHSKEAFAFTTSIGNKSNFDPVGLTIIEGPSAGTIPPFSTVTWLVGNQPLVQGAFIHFQLQRTDGLLSPSYEVAEVYSPGIANLIGASALDVPTGTNTSGTYTTVVSKQPPSASNGGGALFLIRRQPGLV